MSEFRNWVKRREHPVAKTLYIWGKRARFAQVPTVYAIHRPAYEIRQFILWAWNEWWRIVWITPLFQSRLVHVAPGLLVRSGMPQVLGPVEIEFGANCRISGYSTIAGRGASVRPRLTVGSNVEIGFLCTISVGRNVDIGNNVLIAGRCYLAGYPAHPIDPIARAEGRPDLDSQVGDIVLEDDVWLATGVTVLAGVRIGRGTIVAAGSVVTSDLPSMVLAGGVPARVIKSLKPHRSGSIRSSVSLDPTTESSRLQNQDV